MTAWRDEKKLLLAFEISLVLKGLFAVFEIASGLLIYLGSKSMLLGLTHRLIQPLLEQPRYDPLTHYLWQQVQGLSQSSQHFVSLYLLSHGVVKLWLIVGLWRQRLWYYPLAMAVFAWFIAYQLYRYSFSHSWWLLALTVLDVMVIALTWFEYRQLRRHLRADG